MRDKAEVSCSEPRARAAGLLREALVLLEKLDEAIPAFHFKSALALFEDGCLPANFREDRGDEAPGDAFARAISVMMTIIEQTTNHNRGPCADSLARAMELYGKELARRDMGTALLLDRWAEIIREQGVLLEPAERRRN